MKCETAVAYDGNYTMGEAIIMGYYLNPIVEIIDESTPVDPKTKRKLKTVEEIIQLNDQRKEKEEQILEERSKQEAIIKMFEEGMLPHLTEKDIQPIKDFLNQDKTESKSDNQKEFKFTWP